ncbi:cytochrome bd ubiquinol oxidase subunit I [Thermobaculum terrenum ATCC BAA-798]|uniref:Cytochrome bd ubiquinol oxidase subunit I n=1 Tax=Thermobaculum terrenum (strain ATCC BAA-798 / CCMEE 7001 / YNP1) TaxID=525904 RepID=D1CB61_THET1|nr:cytochrome ubiquinol oxidase subunit I [Thermobaculum terrenum]ACZ42026.1 cytochrome bd ubiquinol oxidase subunit I [Thermobaculum terrenum ATCC BAA-798]
MDELLAARFQMAFSLAFHMIFAAMGIGMPVLMLIAEGLWLRTREKDYLHLARKWAKATAVLFAIGAVSGTVLSFELGLLWPKFMEFAGGIIGVAFALEGYAFFIEAIFLGLYLYGWDKLPPKIHWLCGFPVALSGLASGVLVLSANAWMQSPTGFELVGGQPTNIDPVKALFNPAWGVMALHSTLSTYIASAFAVSAVYAFAILRGKSEKYHQRALNIAMAVAAISALLMPLSGDASARSVAIRQPAKLAAMEGLFHSERGAGLSIGGWPDLEREQLRYAVEIPKLLSFLAFHDPNALVRGLDSVPRDQWPNVVVVRAAFQVMVGLGIFLVVVSVWYWASRFWRRLHTKWLYIALVLSGIAGYTALEAGWIVTEVGRQPWIIYGIMRTSEAVTPTEGVFETLIAVVAIYALLSLALVWLLLKLRDSNRNLPALEVIDNAPA